MSLITASTTFQGYRRDNGRVGVRNHVIVLPVDDISTRRPRPSPTTSRARWPCPIPTAGCNSAKTWSCISAR